MLREELDRRRVSAESDGETLRQERRKAGLLTEELETSGLQRDRT